MIDLVDSVALKDQGIGSWCAAMHNLIVQARSWLSGLMNEPGAEESGDPVIQPIGLRPLKVVGDCMMFYVPPHSMAKGADASTIFCSLVEIIRASKAISCKIQPEVHAAISWCQDAYEVTFVDGADDIHGKDIDLTARLLKEAGPQELVMNDAFYMMAKRIFCSWRDAGNRRGNQHPLNEIANVQGPWAKPLKGFKKPLAIYKWCGPRFMPSNAPAAKS